MKILIAYDGSICADAALQDLVRAGLPDSATARVLSVGEHGGTTEQALATAELAVSILKVWFPGWTLTAEGAAGSPARTLVEAADHWQPGLLVVGSHGRTAFGRFLLGSVSHKLVTEARCPVRVARQGTNADAGPPKVIVATDGSEAATAAVRWVAARNWPKGTEAVVMTAVVDYPPGGNVEHHETVAMQLAEWSARRAAYALEVAEAAAEILRRAGLAAVPATGTGPLDRLVRDKASEWGADSIFLGATGAGGADHRALGSAAMHVVMRAPCSVEVVRTWPV